MNRYFVCITISRRHISFEYHQEGANKPLAPFPAEEAWPVPLALYCTPNRIEIGHGAERAALRGVPGAFKEWFRQLSSAQTVGYLGQQQPVSHLLLLASEEQLRNFLKDVRFNMDGGLENCRASMPLVLSFEDDVDDSMRIFLVSLFKNNGYGRVFELYHNRFIAKYFGSKLPSNQILILDSDGSDLTLSLYVRGQEQEKIKTVLPDAGTDPRIHSVCNMIWDKTGAEYSFLDRNAEQSRLEQMAAEVIRANKTEFEGMMHYSNDERLSFMISRSELVASGSGTRSIATDLFRFLEKAGIKPNDVAVVLRNFAAKSDFFSNALSLEFPTLVSYDEEAAEAVNGLIVAYVMPLLGSKEEPVGQKREKPEINNAPSKEHLLDPKALVKLNREMRAARANIKAKYSRGDKEAASLAYKNLIAEWNTEAYADLLAELHDWLAIEGITREDLLRNHEPPKPKKTVSVSEPRERRGSERSRPIKDEPKPSKPDVSEGELLLKNGKFSEAKRFFAGVGNEHMKQLCIDLLRDERDLRAISLQNPSSLSSTTKSNNYDKLKRILNNYRKAGLDTGPVTELMKKYR